MKGAFIMPWTIIIPALIAAAAVIALLLASYVKSPPDMAFIISGVKKTPRILIGRAGVKLPIFERLDRIYLGQISVDIKTDTFIPTNDFINVKVDAVAKIRVRNDKEGLLLAMKNFLNKKPEAIAMELQDSLQGNMREIIGTLSLKAINTDRDSFSDQVMEKASKDMDKLGIEILSCNIQNVIDENGLIKDLGMDNTAKIKKDAAIAKAQADRDVAIEQAKSQKSANDARVEAETEIARRNNELDIRRSELKKLADVKKAEADAAYEIQRQEQEKAIKAATVNAEIAKAERETELRAKEVQVRAQELEASVNKVAEAEKYRAEREAEAQLEVQKRQAEAKKYSAEQEAAGIRAKYEAEAEGIRMRGEAEAEAARRKGLAEAEAMEKKAEAYQKYNGAAMAEMMIRIMPDMAAAIAKPMESIDKINIYGGGAGSGADAANISANIPVIIRQVMDTMSDATGVDLTEIMRSGTYDAKVNRNINVTGIPGVTVNTGEAAEKGGQTGTDAADSAEGASAADSAE
ncbi:MAG: flotillin family protein [Clostridia bacterium]|nr:flotillin family protein [Clostridia bacterium]